MDPKDFAAAAKLARQYVFPHRLSIAEAFASFFATRSPAFDRERFYTACALTLDGRSAHLAAAEHVN